MAGLTFLCSYQTLGKGTAWIIADPADWLQNEHGGHTYIKPSAWSQLTGNLTQGDQLSRP